MEIFYLIPTSGDPAEQRRVEILILQIACPP